MFEWHIKSVTGGIKWPALPTPNGAGRLSTLFQLEQTQWWPHEKIRQHQFQQLRPLLRHSITHVPYYRELLGNRLKPGTLSEEEWHKIPILTRDKVQQAGAQLYAQAMPAGHGKPGLQQTSGSTGKPIETLGTDMTRFFWNVFTLREHLWHRRDLSGKLAVVRYTKDEKACIPNGIRATNWGHATSGLIQTGECVLLSIFTPIPEIAAWLQREQPNYLLTHPSVLQGLALHCEQEGIRYPSLREVRTISEALPDGLRELCQKVWGAKLVDLYSTIELGNLALQCPEHEHYHVQSEGVLLEVLDDSGKPCAPGEVGRVIVTNLHNYASPLIRYEVGDYAEVGEACDCGRGLPVLKRIIGRYRNLLTLPSGKQVWPKLGILNLHEIAPIKQFQAVQQTLTDIEFRLVLPRPLQEVESSGLRERFQQALGPSFNITIRQVETLQRSASGKYEEFISKL